MAKSIRMHKVCSSFYIIMIIAQGRCVQGWPRYYASELQPIGELGSSEGTLRGFFLTEILLITKTTTLSTLSWDQYDQKSILTSLCNTMQQWYIHISSTDRLPHQIDILLIKRPMRKQYCLQYSQNGDIIMVGAPFCVHFFCILSKCMIFIKPLLHF